MTVNGKLKSIQKNYDVLTPHERFTAMLAAFGRNDTSECLALVDSCPKYTYRMADYEYRRRFDAAERLADLILFDIQAQLLYAYMSVVEADPDSKIVFFDVLTAAAGQWAGLKLFCDDIGATLDNFLMYSSYGLNREGAKLVKGKPNFSARIFNIVLVMFETLESKTDPATVEASRAECHRFWDWAVSPDAAFL